MSLTKSKSYTKSKEYATERRNYLRALKIIKDYPDALKVIEAYELKIINNPQTEIILEDGYVNLYKKLPIRAINCLRAYFYEYSKTEINLENFEIKLLLGIDFRDLKYNNCGRKSLNSIRELIKSNQH